MTNDFSQEVAEVLKQFEHAASLVECFKAAAGLTDRGNSEKRFFNVALASGDAKEITMFASTYATALKSMGTIETSKVVEADWRDFLKDSTKVVKLQEAFKEAAGGVLLIRNAYEDNQALEGQLANYAVAGELCNQTDKADVDLKTETVTESPLKPVVILTGDVSSMQYARDKDKIVFTRFWSKVGFKPATF